MKKKKTKKNLHQKVKAIRRVGRERNSLRGQIHACNTPASNPMGGKLVSSLFSQSFEGLKGRFVSVFRRMLIFVFFSYTFSMLLLLLL